MVTTGFFIVRLANYFYPECGSMTLLRNFSKYIPVYMVSSERRGYG